MSRAVTVEELNNKLDKAIQTLEQYDGYRRMTYILEAMKLPESPVQEEQKKDPIVEWWEKYATTEDKKELIERLKCRLLEGGK